jgi:ribose transport system substrate-binding protein
MGSIPQPLRTWRRAGTVALAVTAGAFGLAACGSSSSSSSSSAAASANTSTSSGSTGNGGSSTTSANSGSSSSSTGGSTSLASWCGSKPITLGIQDGGGLNAWSAASLQQVKQEAALCPAIKKEIVVDADFTPEKATSGLQSMIAQGANAIVIIPDSGNCAELAQMRAATQRGIKVAAWASNPCGTVGQDYQSYTDQNTVAAGSTALQWMAKQLHGKGNVLYLGGPAGNGVDQGLIQGVEAANKQYPGIKILDNVSTKSWPVAGWSTAGAEKETSALLAKYPNVDGVIDMYGADAIGDVAAFNQAGRKMPPIITTQLNSLSCEWKKDQGTSKAFSMADMSNRNWMGRLAVRQAVSAVNGLKDSIPQSIKLKILEDSTVKGDAPVCYAGKSPNYDPSNSWSDAKVIAESAS